MLHELWKEGDGCWTFCLAGPLGDGARSFLDSEAQLVWTVEASSHFDAMTKYYEYQDWGVYSTDFPEADMQTYAERGWE